MSQNRDLNLVNSDYFFFRRLWRFKPESGVENIGNVVQGQNIEIKFYTPHKFAGKSSDHCTSLLFRLNFRQPESISIP